MLYVPQLISSSMKNNIFFCDFSVLFVSEMRERERESGGDDDDDDANGRDSV